MRPLVHDRPRRAQSRPVRSARVLRGRARARRRPRRRSASAARSPSSCGRPASRASGERCSPSRPAVVSARRRAPARRRRPGHVRRRRDPARGCGARAPRRAASRRSRRRCSTRRHPTSTARSPRRRSPKASASAATSSCATSPDAKASKLARGHRRRARQRQGARRRSTRGARIARSGGVGARPHQRARGGEVAGRRRGARQAASRAHPGSRSRCSRASNSCGSSMGGVHRRRVTARTARRGSCGSSTRRPAARAPLALRRQGCGVRLRRPLAEDRGRHGDDEDRHVGRGRGDRRDVDARATSR